MAFKAVAVKKPAGKSLPPWLQKAQDEGKAEGKSGKPPSQKHEKGESAKFEKAEEAAMPKKKMADGGPVNKGKATNPKATSKNLPKGAGNAKGGAHLMANGGKVK